MSRLRGDISRQPLIPEIKRELLWNKGCDVAGLPVTLHDEPIVVGMFDVLDWRRTSSGYPVQGVAMMNRAGFTCIKLSAPDLTWLAVVVLWHEIGHVKTMTPQMLTCLRKNERKYRKHFLHQSETNAWKWAKRQLGQHWDQEAETLALAALRTYGIKCGEIA